MRNSLHNKLTCWLKEEGKISYISLATECLKGKHGKLLRMYKMDTVSRRLREMREFGHPHYNPNVADLVENGSLVGWAWNGTPPEKQYTYFLEEKAVSVRESLLPRFLLNHPHARKLSTSN